MTIVTDKNLTVLSNTRIASQRVDGTKKTVAFARTALMSTYLVAPCVGEFESSAPAFRQQQGAAHLVGAGKNRAEGLRPEARPVRRGVVRAGAGVPFFGGDKIDMIAIPDFRSEPT